MADRYVPWELSRRRLLQAGGLTSMAALLAGGALPAFADPTRPPGEDGDHGYSRVIELEAYHT